MTRQPKRGKARTIKVWAALDRKTREYLCGVVELGRGTARKDCRAIMKAYRDPVLVQATLTIPSTSPYRGEKI